MVYLELAIVAVLIVVNGLLSMSELAIVSARTGRLKVLAERGSGGAQRALALSADPGRFLSTVQIGITLVGVLSGAFSGATLGLRFTHWLEGAGMPQGAAETLGVGTVVAVITYASLIIGELAPKQIALRDPEGVAVRVAPAMTLLAKIASPLVTLLDGSGKLVLRMLGLRAQAEGKITDEEIKTIIAEAEGAGVLHSDERRMISGVMRLGDRPVRGIMTPRNEVDWIDLTAPEEELRALVVSTQHARLPVGEAIDALIGVVRTREILAALVAGKPFDIRAHVVTAPVVYDNADALDVLGTLRTAAITVALVHDEYGHFSGVVTPANILEAITGVFQADEGDAEAAAHRREDGSWLLAGHLPADEMADHLSVSLGEERDYQTVGGFVLAHMRRLPATGDSFEVLGWRFEVVDLDGRRIDKVLAFRPPPKRRLS